MTGAAVEAGAADATATAAVVTGSARTVPRKAADAAASAENAPSVPKAKRHATAGVRAMPRAAKAGRHGSAIATVKADARTDAMHPFAPKEITRRVMAVKAVKAAAAASAGESGDAPRQQPLGTDAGMGAVAPDVGIEGQGAAPQERGERGPRNGERRERRERGGDRRPRGEEGQAEFVDTSPMASLPDLDLTGGEAGSPATGSTPGEEPRRERRSRDRYGRDRRERAPREGAEVETAPVTETTTAQAVQDVAGEGPAQEAPRRSYFSQGGGAPAPTAAAVASEASHGEAPAEPAQAPAGIPAAAPAPAVAAAAVPVPVPVPVATPAPAPAAAAAVPGLPRVQAFQLPVDELNRIAESSGLQWVNSDAEKIAAAQAAIAAEPRPVHVPREGLRPSCWTKVRWCSWKHAEICAT